MVTGLLGSRGLMSTAVILTLVLAAAIGLRLSAPNLPMRDYCADMPDSIGLYEGSAVTVLGVQVGRVTAIEPLSGVSRVRFVARADRTLPSDVGAVTVSDTLVSDRKLALIGAEPSGSGWDARHCITKTLTPKSLSQTFEALAGLADRLNGSGDPAQRNAFGFGLEALDNATSGAGDQINAIIQQLGAALAEPDAAIGHIGRLLDALAELAHRARGGWSQVEASISGLPRTFGDINVLAFPPIIDLVAALADVLPQFNDLIMMAGSPALRALDATPDLARLIAAGVGSLTEIIEHTPAIAGAFAGAIDPATGQLGIGYAPPKLQLPQPQSAQICAALEAVTAQGCQSSASGAVTVPAIPLLLAAVSGK
ncbi:MlaD family protein [Nocardia niwae]|uniref:MlaD family protein n=1 Tax=Nocardia niwae TaxID=626084 RepID=A0ABV2XGL1_9NOCA